MKSSQLAFALAFMCCLAEDAHAQKWLERLAPQEGKEVSFRDARDAFDKYYREHPVDLALDKVAPTFKFEGEVEVRNRMDVESYKLFRRAEWFLGPRTYPDGTIDLDKVDALRAAVRDADAALEPKEPEAKAFSARWRRTKWRQLGPDDAVGGTNMGRVNCVEFDPANANVLYLCAADGGVWKSMDGGVTWKPKFDFERTLSVGDIAVDRQHPKRLFVATSDAFGYGTPFWGGTYSVGIMRSDNGGNTWTHTGLSWTVKQNRTIRRLVIHPTNGHILLAATSVGVYRTVNGGATWTKIINGSAYDVEFQPNNGNIAYATTNTVLKSTNAGATFTALSATCAGARYNVKIANSKPNVLYTLCTNGTVQKSVDSGATWTTAAASGVSLYGYYDNVLAVSPVDDRVVYVAGFDIKRTTDGGATWAGVPVAGHVDNHTIKFAPGSGTTLYSGNDGGLFKSTDGGSTWTSLNKGLAITQFYRIGLSASTPGLFVVGAQDNGNMKRSAGAFSSITNADGMQDFIDWSNDNNIYAAIQYGGFYRSTNGGATFTPISTPSSGAWVAPWCQDPVTANTLYAGTDKVYRSTNQGTVWTAISGALAGVGAFEVLGVAPGNPSVIYAGGGTKLYRTSNGGTTWTDITSGLPVATNYLTAVAISDADPQIAYATFSGYVAGEKVYRTTNGGTSWTNISAGLPNMPVNAIVHEKGPGNRIYIGTDAGVYYRNDSLTHWIPHKFGLPNVIVDDLKIQYGAKKIRAATYGRGVWEAPLL